MPPARAAGQSPGASASPDANRVVGAALAAAFLALLIVGLTGPNAAAPALPGAWHLPV